MLIKRETLFDKNFTMKTMWSILRKKIQPDEWTRTYSSITNIGVSLFDTLRKEYCVVIAG